MKRTHALAIFLFAATFGPGFSSAAPDAVTASAEREEMEANYKRMNSRVEELQETVQSQQKIIEQLRQQLHNLREDVDRLKNRNENAATDEKIKRLVESVEEVDKKRQKDNDLVQRQFKSLEKTLSRPLPAKDPTPAPPAPQKEKEKSTSSGTGSPVDKAAFTYQIKSGDTLVKIVGDLSAQGYKVTQKQIEETNPGVNWKRLKVGQTIFIPPSSP